MLVNGVSLNKDLACFKSYHEELSHIEVPVQGLHPLLGSTYMKREDYDELVRQWKE